MQESGSLTSLLCRAPQLSGTRILCFHILSCSGLAVGSGYGLLAARWQVFFPSQVPVGLTRRHWRPAITDDYDIIVY